jgi:hypothetical protein
VARTLPATTYEVPGSLVSGEVWNNGPKVLNDFLSNRPAMQLSDDFIQTIGNNAWTPVNYAINYLDTDGGHNTSVNPQMCFAQVAGWYWVRASISFNPGPAVTTRIDTVLAKNGAIIPGTAQFLTRFGAVAYAQQASSLVFLNPGDRVELWTRQLSGGNMTTDTGTIGINNGMTVLWVHS